MHGNSAPRSVLGRPLVGRLGQWEMLAYFSCDLSGPAHYFAVAVHDKAVTAHVEFQTRWRLGWW